MTRTRFTLTRLGIAVLATCLSLAIQALPCRAGERAESPTAATAEPNASEAPAPGPVLDAPPTPTRTVAPVYPDEARRRQQEGMVMLQVYVTQQGKVRTVRVAPGKGLAPDLDRAAMVAVKQWEFTPARVKGKPVATWVVIPVRFRLH